MSRRTSLALWSGLWNAGLLVALIGLPALLGYLAGLHFDETAGRHLVPFRLLFVALGVAFGGITAWRLLKRQQP
jgi:hypothetical protein